MADTTILEYKCPCCGASLVFSQASQMLSCDSCNNEFEINAVKEFNDIPEQEEQTFSWEEATQAQLSGNNLSVYECPSCGGQLITDASTVATFCPYCCNPSVIPARLTGTLKPDGVIPFKTSQKDAEEAFLQLCKGKPLLPRDFTSKQQLKKITGTYVPFWLYSCDSSYTGSFSATRFHCWADSRYNYTKTDHYLLKRSAKADFECIPMDGSSKMDNTIMESIEPFDYGQMVDFDTAYLSGYFADKYDVEARSGEERIRQRVTSTVDDLISSSCRGYAAVIPKNKNLKIEHGKAKYVLLPVWILTSRYKDQLYTFAMNGQSGKMTGTFPICPKRSTGWFAGICAGVTALVSLLLLLL